MDYSSLKKLALAMGEEFKIIDNVTLEAVNVQRLITKEKEYCSTLESLIKSSEEEIDSLERETSTTKRKLDDISNKGSLLQTSMESLNSSHSMVEMLKRDLLKQLQLEGIRTCEQNMNFESTLKKYEEMWEHYKDVYQKFPLVSDLHAIESKLKLKNIQLSLLEKEAKDYQRKISELINIQEKKEKSLLIKVAEKYIIREKMKRERDNLEKSIKLKRKKLEIEKHQGLQPLSYKSSSSLLLCESEDDKQISNSLSLLMDTFITELGKENIPFIAEKAKCAEVQHRSFLDYGATLSRGISDAVLKLPPLPVFDSPPRKIRSVGNLLSPPKEWTKECGYEAEVKSQPSTEMSSSESPLCDSRGLNSQPDAKEPDATNEMMVDAIESEPSGSHAQLEASENKLLVEDFEADMAMEVDVVEESKKVRSTSPKFEGEKIQMESDNGDTNDQENIVHAHCGINNPVNIPESPEFTYEPRIKKVAKVQGSAPETTSPYFAASSYLNFMDIPSEIVNKANNETDKQMNKRLNDEVKGSIPVIDLVDEMEQNDGQQNELVVHKADHENAKEFPMMDSLIVKAASSAPKESDVEIDNEDIHNNKDVIPNNCISDDQLPVNDSSVTVQKSESSPGYKEKKFNETAVEVTSPQPSQMHDDLNISYGSPLNYSQMSYADSIDYQDAYQSFSPEASSVDESPQFIPVDHRPDNIFRPCEEKSGFSYGFSSAPQQPSAASLFGNTRSENSRSKERKQNEMFNFSFDTKSKTSSMFKLF